ncbi:hypothetical protein GLAREA_09955 [Glarea lozoyensis ATCC 20868]|uniref:Uncharacterized protein n=1 Tax=Glarea lozoyensis (strain ATCC 20868 / MF5171) TaxID=1116229 RepID=S3CV54_GLAL2|nr:uncharacterized protein GLAREA_09955 [Glarea lozoyensis ATCC 20868]EPE28834.1 hypothetical protein GLAREA_09955 [Glarea lozoyensis ATCC 20868]
MTDENPNNAFELSLWSYHDENSYDLFDEWLGLAPLVSPPPSPMTANSSDDIESIYTGLHRSVDKVVAQMSIRTPAQLDQIREQNRKLIKKLITLESVITRDSAAPTGAAESHSRSTTSISVDDRVRRKRRRVLPATDPETVDISVTCTPNVARHESSSVESHSPGIEACLVDGDSKLAKKLLQIGNQEARTQVVEFEAQLRASQYQKTLPNMYQFSSVTQLTDMSYFMRLVVDLGMVIESSIFGEQMSRIRKRIAFAHFYHAYTLAQNNPSVFLTWCDNQKVQFKSMLRKGGHKSVVQHRFAELVFSRPDNHGGASSPSPSDTSDDLKRRMTKIQTWRKSGKRWAQIIQRFGYGILLLLPYSLSDEEMRVARDKIIDYCLDLIDSRKHLFVDVLQKANDLLDMHFFPQNAEVNLTNDNRADCLDVTDWDDLLSSPVYKAI